jgi:ABC-type molybdate transport system substrate-binding protein
VNDLLEFGARDETPARVLCAGAVREALIVCAQAFCAARPDARLALQVDTSGGALARLARGERFHLIAAASDALDALAGRGALSGARVALGASRLALGVRVGEAAPDVSTLEAFSRTLLDARAFSRGDPAGGGTGGRLIEEGLARLGLLEPTRAKTLLRVGGHRVMAAVADGEADFGLTQSTEIAAAPGVEVAAFLPAGLQVETRYEACALAEAGDDVCGEEARAFLAHLAGAQGRAAFAAAGFFGA